MHDRLSYLLIALNGSPFTKVLKIYSEEAPAPLKKSAAVSPGGER